MQIREFSKPVTSKQLNENVAKQFGYKLKLEQFSDVQLEDVRNKLRTEMSQFELSENFDSLPQNGKYQKTRALLDVINQEIMERESKPDFADLDDDGDEEEPMKKAAKEMNKEEKTDESYVNQTFRKRAMAHSVPTSWINNALSRVELGESDRSELKAELKIRYDLTEAKASWILLEGEEDKAEIIMATKDMVDRITGWLEDVAAMKAEQLLELTDSIREALGSDVAQQYTDAVKPALEAIYTALETSRQGLSGALAVVSGGEAPMMGGAPTGGAMPGASAPEAAPMGAPEPGAELGAPAGGEAGREKRESVEYSRHLSILLNSKKK